MYYRKALRAAGFDPDKIRDAQKADGFTIHITAKELKGSVIGNPMKCSGAKACLKQTSATFAWIGAEIAILGFADGGLVRYRHNGHISKGQDEGMFPVGSYQFRHIVEADKPSVRKVRERDYASRSSRTHKDTAHKDLGLIKAVVFHPQASLAAQMRRGWEVEAG